MNDDNQALWEPHSKPVVVHPGPASIDDLLKHVDPAPDEEIDRFVSSIYADRREAAGILPAE
jgi:hypothetical protein